MGGTDSLSAMVEGREETRMVKMKKRREVMENLMVGLQKSNAFVMLVLSAIVAAAGLSVDQGYGDSVLTSITRHHRCHKT